MLTASITDVVIALLTVQLTDGDDNFRPIDEAAAIYEADGLSGLRAFIERQFLTATCSHSDELIRVALCGADWTLIEDRVAEVAARRVACV